MLSSVKKCKLNFFLIYDVTMTLNTPSWPLSGGGDLCLSVFLIPYLVVKTHEDTHTHRQIGVLWRKYL